jgi:hypothetical protein
MGLRGRASLAPGVCSDNASVSCTTDSQCANSGVGTCANDPNVVCELDIQCGSCAATSPTPGVTCIADRDCGGTCSNNGAMPCTRDGDCGGVCREDGVTPCSSDADCDFGCEISNTCVFFVCETQPCDVAKCRPVSPADVPLNVASPGRFFNPMLTVHWNGDRDEVEDFEFTFRSLLGAGDCDGVEDLPDKCIGALLMRSNVAKPQEANPDLGDGNRGLSPRLDHLADYVYSLTSFVRNPNLAAGPSPDAVIGGMIFSSPAVRCAECHLGPSPANQHFTDKRTLATHPPGQQGGPDVLNPFLRHNVGTFNVFDLTDPFVVARDIGQFQNAVLPIPASRGPLVDYLTPTLVDVWNTAPFNHDGSFATLLHGITPCSSALDDCRHADAGKNVDDLHGTTSVLTPRQLRQLEEFLDAPHSPAGGPVRLAQPLARIDRAKIRFGAGGGDDRLDLKATLTLAPSSSFEVQDDRLAEAVTVSLADVDEEDVIERSFAAGTLRANAAGTRFVMVDPAATQGIRRLLLKRIGDGPGWRVTVQGRNLDLGALDKNHITVAVEVGDDAFVRTRTFRQPRSGQRTVVKVSERRPR